MRICDCSKAENEELKKENETLKEKLQSTCYSNIEIFKKQKDDLVDETNILKRRINELIRDLSNAKYKNLQDEDTVFNENSKLKKHISELEKELDQLKINYDYRSQQYNDLLKTTSRKESSEGQDRWFNMAMNAHARFNNLCVVYDRQNDRFNKYLEELRALVAEERK